MEKYSNVKYEAFYITPEREDGEKYYCRVKKVIGAGSEKNTVTYALYPKTMFQKNFHGTLIVFTRDMETITNIDEMVENFDIHFEYVTSYNSVSKSFSASDGVIYSLNDNYYCKNNPTTRANLIAALEACDDFYMALVIEDKTGRLLDITLICDVKKDMPYAYDHRVVKGFLPLDYRTFRDVVNMKNALRIDNDEKLSQDDIDKLLQDLYVR